jgi:dTDP-4-dehydrorhamnose 3,5-epimerase
MTYGSKAKQTVSKDGKLIQELINGVEIYYPTTHQDDRGSLCEIFNRQWGFEAPETLHAYLVTVRPGRVKGWAVHDKQVDQYFFVSGTSKLVLFDSRSKSESHSMINELFFSELNRALVAVPPGVYHAVEAVGQIDSLLFNIPNQPYNYKDPDKYTVPLENDFIPYSFGLVKGF